jgi:hypothetical protein
VAAPQVSDCIERAALPKRASSPESKASASFFSLWGCVAHTPLLMLVAMFWWFKLLRRRGTNNKAKV